MGSRPHCSALSLGWATLDRYNPEGHCPGSRSGGALSETLAQKSWLPGLLVRSSVLVDVWSYDYWMMS